MSDHGVQITQTRTEEAFDRPISLIDATRPAESGTAEDSRKASLSPSWRYLAKRPTKDSVKEGLAKWRYSKWQQDRFASDQRALNGEDQPQESCAASSQQPQPTGIERPQTDNTNAVQRQASPERGRRRLKNGNEGVPATKAEKPSYEFDVLYENQRGWFFFGIPLYSHSSLLNFDPAPWITKDGKDSAVNITNAQLPDPSWQWAWKSWYVDMSYDVDEEGWQYSFSFSRKFSWHGTHPWFHCFVRRRRWLRKRIKRQGMKVKDAGEFGGAHSLTNDYFTIHPNRGRSPGSGLESKTNGASSQISRGAAEEANMPPEDIKDVPSLLKALRLATIDREKIDAVTRFVEDGGEELAYLSEQIPEIMGFLVFQVSRRQLLEYLMKTANEAMHGQPSNTAEAKRAKSLQNAIHAADGQIFDLEYWSDRQHVLNTFDENSQGRGATFSESSAIVPKDNNPVDVVKGISEDAEVGVDSTKSVLSPPPENRLGLSEAEGGSDRAEEKGQDAELEQDDSEGIETPISLPRDSVKVDD